MGNKEASGTCSLPLEGLTFYSRKTYEQTFLKGERHARHRKGHRQGRPGLLGLSGGLHLCEGVTAALLNPSLRKP